MNTPQKQKKYESEDNLTGFSTEDEKPKAPSQCKPWLKQTIGHPIHRKKPSEKTGMPTTSSMVQASIRNEIYFSICEDETLKSGTQEGTGDLKVKENIGQIRHFIQQHTGH